MAKENNGAIGCVSIFLLIILIPQLITFIEFIVSKVIALIGFLIPIAVGCGIAYAIYLLVQYNQRTRKVELLFEKIFRLNAPTKDNTNLLEGETIDLLGESENKKLKNEVEVLKEKLIQIEKEKEKSKVERKREIEKAVQQYTEKIGKEKKSEVLNQIFGEGNNKKTDNYSRSDEFEKQQFEETNKKKKEELDVREIKQDMNEQLFEQDKKIHEQDIKINARVDAVESEMRTGFLNYDYKLLHLEKEFISFKGLVVERFAQVEANFEKAFAVVQEQIGNLRVELKQDIADAKVQFGKEIMRIDKQQMSIIDKMRQYEHQVKAFAVDMQKVKIEVEKFSLKGERMLQMSSTIYQRHKAEMYAQSKDIQVGLQQMAIHKGDFSNKVGQAKLMLDEISNDQYLALKDMAYERVGINMLRQEHDQRSNLEEQKMQHLLTKQQNLGEKIRIEQSHGREVSGLKHQLFLTGENLQFTQNRASLMRQEQSIMNRLTK